MKVQGVDLSALSDQFEGYVEGRTLIMDGDGPAYVVSSTVKRLDTAVRRFQTMVLEQMFLTQAQTARIHLTSSDCTKNFRYLVRGEKPYQGNRKDKDKPALLEPLRQAMCLEENWLPEFEFVRMHREVEADDAMMQDAYRLQESGITWSDDKDLRMTPYPYWDAAKGRVSPSEPFGWLTPKCTPSGTVKLIGQGPLFFWAQMLMGDTADNIKGIRKLNGKLCGPAKAYEALQDVQDIHEAANTVVSGYRDIDQNPLPEGWMLWLTRWEGDSFWHYVQSLELSKENREYIRACASRPWFVDAAVAATEHGDHQADS